MKRVGKNSIALGLVIALITLALSFSANGATPTKSHSAARFLSGTLLGTDLDKVAALEGIEAANPATKTVGSDPASNPLKLSVLGIPLANSPIPLDLAGFLSPTNGSAGVANQYAKAPSDSSAAAASGAVSDQGAILDPDNQQFPSNANISLTGGLLDPSISGLTGLNLNVGALTGKSSIEDGKVTRQYQIGDLTLDLDVPLLKGIASDLNAAGNSTVNKINDLDLNAGSLLCAVGDTANVATNVLTGLPAPLGGLIQTALALLNLDTIDLCHPPAVLSGLIDQIKGLANVNISGLGTIAEGLQNFTENGVGVNFDTGKISVNLETLLASQNLNLDKLPANTDLLQYLTSDLVAGKVTSLVNSAINDILLKVTDLKVSVTLGGATVIPATALADITGPVADAINALKGPLDDALKAIGDPIDQSLTGLTANLPKVVQLTANNQVESPTDGSGTAIPAAVGKTYDVSALKLTLGGGDLATVNLASAQAGLDPADATDADAQAAADTDTNGDAQAAADADSNGDAQAAADTDTNSNADAVADQGSDANADAAADADANAAADADVTSTLPNTGAPNVLPLLFLALGLVAFGAAVLANEKRRMNRL